MMISFEYHLKTTIMIKGKNFTGQPIFSQVLQLIPKSVVSRLSKVHGANRYVKTFDSYHHLVSMLFCVYQRCSSLREVSTGMQAWLGRLQHLGLKSYPKRSTLSDTNKRCPAAFFQALYHELVKIYSPELLPDSRKGSTVDERLMLMDSTTIDLFNDVMGGAGMSKSDGRRKGGVKVHMLVNPIHQIPSVIYLTEAKENDRVFMDKIAAPKGSILVFDKGYFKFSQWQQWTEQGIYWVTRLSRVSFYYVLEERPVNAKQKEAGVLADQIILLGRGTNPGSEVIQARRIVYFDTEKNRIFEFVTNNERFSPANIAGLYKKRWYIETMFKSLKQNYQLKYFLGDNANAICIQIWCSLIADLLIKVIRKSIKSRGWSLSNLSSLIRMHLGTYVQLKEFLRNPEAALKQALKNNCQQYELLFNTT
jgi:hypothetical protein